MAIPKKGSRKIVVDSVEYRWTIRNKPTYSQGAFGNNMTAAAELAEQSGAVLSITFPWVRCDNWIGNPELPVTPKDIEYCIRAALQNGWQPEKKGSAFNFVHEMKI
ncbi:hypothetical protein [Pseudoalteromonas luteoviolacea]|uniref:Uncharacterized protein n=1 Tax=Pseudoalteromonas luteoviolacea DSM 6061 TaxID=1365250 RepID=A0A167CWG5_9GAMM|nr:hypothetical protein [Pseudoalteromonas luteoviolacea]KZN48145.1 hypothetical protein N475_25490 [Pseudoalteromonas luteoviolacea DSM 6061]MBE0388664.1 hypothetical protein [Pseudoalteromonas luteoviolacea DSM 6061]